MALEVVEHLRAFGQIEPELLAKAFSRRYRSDPRRGYGGAMHSLLPQLRTGEWQLLASELFNGSGSFGNGAAMRSAPLGAYFAHSPQLCAEAACFAARVRESVEEMDLIAEVLPFVPDGQVKSGLEEARELRDATVEEAAESLGTGVEVSAQDTVPFCLWCAARNLDDYKSALWETVSGLGDRDTTCAIVGGIVASRTGTEGIPAQWLENREPLG